MDTQDSKFEKQIKREKKKWAKRHRLVFMILLFALLAFGLILPLRPTFSDVEKRALTKFPEFSLSGLWDGSYGSGLVTWYGDTFPMREQLLLADSTLERAYGLRGEELHGQAGRVADDIPDAPTTPAPIVTIPASRPTQTPTPTPMVTAEVTDVPSAPETAASSAETAVAETPVPEETEAPEFTDETGLPDGAITAPPEMSGAVYVAGNCGFDVYYFNHGGADAYASMINTVRSILPESTTVYSMLAPTSFGILLPEDVQLSLGGSNTEDAFSYIYQLMDPSIRQVHVFDTLLNHNAEYIYFNTDHHWTALGAYYAYRVYASEAGFAPQGLDEFDTADFDGFLGSFYSYSDQSEALRSNPDTIHAYIPRSTNLIHITNQDYNPMDWPIINDVSEYSQGQKYSCFIGGDNPFSVIDNPDLSDGSSCVIIKESYGNAFVPFLVGHYQHVYVVDYRYYEGDLGAFIRDNNVKDVLFLNNADALSEHNSALMLSCFAG